MPAAELQLKSNNNNMYGGHKADDYGGHPAPAGRALPNLINAVRMLKSKSKTLKSTQSRGF